MGFGKLKTKGKENAAPEALMAERSSGNMPGNAGFFRYQREGCLPSGWKKVPDYSPPP
jgi:hypothetical protein